MPTVTTTNGACCGRCGDRLKQYEGGFAGLMGQLGGVQCSHCGRILCNDCHPPARGQTCPRCEGPLQPIFTRLPGRPMWIVGDEVPASVREEKAAPEAPAPAGEGDRLPGPLRRWAAHSQRNPVLAAAGAILALVAGIRLARPPSPPPQPAAVQPAAAAVPVGPAEENSIVRTFEAHSGPIRAVAFSDDGRRILAGGADRVTRLWDAPSGRLVRALGGHKGQVTSVALSPGGSRALTGGRDKTARLWDLETGRALQTYEFETAVNSVAFSGDGLRILVGLRDGMLDLNGNEFTQSYFPDGISFLGFSRDGRRVLAGYADGTARYHQPNRQEVLLSSHADAVRAAAVGPGGELLATGSEDGTVRLWDANSGNPIHMLDEHTGPVAAAAFSADGQRLVTAGGDKTVRIWDAASGRELLVLTGHTAYVTSAAFSRDGRSLVTAGKDGSVILWNLNTLGD